MDCEHLERFCFPSLKVNFSQGATGNHNNHEAPEAFPKCRPGQLGRSYKTLKSGATIHCTNVFKLQLRPTWSFKCITKYKIYHKRRFSQIAQPVRGLYPNYAPEGGEHEAQTKSDVVKKICVAN